MGDIAISMIAAVAANDVIGADNDMPWRLSTDLKRFKALTMGKPIIMGRRTYESVGKALPGRLNIVITRQPGFTLTDASVVSSLDAALDLANLEAQKNGVDEIMITGGGQIYRQAMDHATKLYITHVRAEPGGDTLFPAIDPKKWQQVLEEVVAKGEKDTAETIYRVYRRLSA